MVEEGTPFDCSQLITPRSSDQFMAAIGLFDKAGRAKRGNYFSVVLRHGNL